MTKVKYLVLLLVSAMLLLVLPNISNAATEYTYSDTEQGIEWVYELDDSENVINLRCKTTSKTGAVTIPSTIDGKTVISLAHDNYGTGAFADCSGITEITIPDTITVIGYNAFKNCTGLKTVTIPNSVTKLEDNAFYGCSGLISVTLSTNLTTIGANAFRDCTGLKNIVMPDTVTTIGAGAFKSCSGLKELTLSNNLTKISESAFYECKGLTSVVIPESVTTIEGEYSWYGAFGDCTKLEKVLIPDSVSTIEEDAFSGCTKLTIYGNDGQASKTYAEENEINFKYISQWNDSEVGDDITPPTVEKLRIEYSSHFDYEEESELYYVAVGSNIAIHATFSETIQGTVAPTLTIKCGNGENIEITNGVIAGTKVVYTYTIKEQDKGIITAVSLTGGDLKDEAGNAAELSCPELTDSIWGHFVYANGSATNPDYGTGDEDTNNGTNNETNNGTNNETNNGTNNETNNGTNNETDKDTNNDKNNQTNDKTQATGKIPHAGSEIGIIFAIIAVVIAGAVVYSRYNKMKDIL